MDAVRARRVHGVVLVSFALAIAVEAVFAFREGLVATQNQYLIAGLLLPLALGCRLVPLHIAYKRKMLTDSAPLFAAALLLSPWLAGAVAAGGMAIAEAAGRGPGYRNLKQLVFNSSQRLLSVVGAAIVFQAMPGSALSHPDVATLGAAAAAMVTMLAINDLLLLAVITAQLGPAVWHDWLFDRRDLPYDVALYVSGFGVAIAASFHLWLLPMLVFPVAIFYRAMRDGVTLRTQTRDAVEALADVVDARDPYTAEHSKRVAEYARGICRKLGLSQDVADEIVAAARVHDVGKVGVRDAVLLKPTQLTDEEFGEIKQHPDIGARLTARFPDFGRGTGYIRHHHEKWDGSGYPLGLKGDHIPLGARVIAVADTYDAITSTRVYRGALPEEFARSEMSRVAGTQLDPEVVDAFFAYQGWTPRVSERAPDFAGLPHPA